MRFREPVVRRYEPLFRWAGPAPSVPAGEKGELVLELVNWDPEKAVPQGFFKGRAPRNAILEENPPAETGEGAYRYTIGIIPLEESSVVLEAVSFQAGGYSLNIPGITAQVLPGRQPQKSGRESAVSAGEPETLPGAFPESREKVFPLFRREYNRIIAGVQTLWEEGRRAEALAEIRKNERDSLAGPSLVPLRREMEQALSLGFTEDEKWRPLKVPFLFWVILGIFALLAASILLFFRPPAAIQKKSVTSRRCGGFKTVIVVVLLICLVLVFLEEGLENFPVGRLSSPANAAVLKRSPAYRVPDLKGAVNARFDEGQPVITGDYTGEWCYAESPDGRSGWVPREAVIAY